MEWELIQYILYLLILIALAIPLGKYIATVMDGESNKFIKLLSPIEKAIYKVCKINDREDMTWKHYTIAVIVFNIMGFIFLMILQLLQGLFLKGTGNIHSPSLSLAINTAISFVTNTNWQSYSGESTMTIVTQVLGMTVQNFVSAATGISVLFALIRGFKGVKEKNIGNYWVDMTRSIVYILLPLSLVLAIALSSQGVVQSMSSSNEVKLIQPIAVDKNGELMKGVKIVGKTVYVDGKVDNNAKVVDKEYLPLGTAASQVAIKQLGTNGGGYFGTNSAHPFENPNAFTNLIEMVSILLIPAALCFSFGVSIKNKRQGKTIFIAMFIMLIFGLLAIGYNEMNATSQLTQHGLVSADFSKGFGGNMQGKEARFGIASTSTWTAFTTAASNGSVNSMLDSYTPLASMFAMLQIQLGEVIFGGVGSGLYGMLAFAILTVFISGLMVGRTPEFLGKKIEPYEMKWAVLVCLATPVSILIGSGIASSLPNIMSTFGNTGAHGFTELLYNFSSAGGNNGSAFAGQNTNTIFLNLFLGVCMIFSRYLPIIGTLAIAGNMASKKKIAQTSGTLSTTNFMFIFLLIFVVLLIGALSFLPAIALGPIAEYLHI